MNAKTTKESASKISISANSDVLDKLKELRADKTNGEFLAELIEAYEILHGLKNSEELEDYFPNLRIKKKGETDEDIASKELTYKEFFGLENNDKLRITEDELLKKACECSGKSMMEMALEGRVLVAKNEIGRQVQYKLGKGKKGQADERIGDSLKLIVQMGQKLSINRLTQASGSNRKSVESWLEREQIKTNGSDLDKDSVAAWCENN